MIKKIFSFVLLTIMLFGFTQVNATTSSTSSGYNTRILDNSLNFKAEYHNGDVYTSWTAYDQNDTFKYYKVVRSTTVSDPVYPDNGYIKAESNINNTKYVDLSPKLGTSYYRVCAITSEMNRYCSNVVKLYIEKDKSNTVCTMEYAPVCGYKNENYKTYSNKCMLEADGAVKKHYGVCTTSTVDNSGLSSLMKIKSINIVNRFITALELKGYTSSKNAEMIDAVIDKLKELKEEKSSLGILVDYLIVLLEEKKEKYKNDFTEIEEIFNLD